MRLGSYVASAVSELNQKNIFAGKTNIQKLVYFALPDKLRKQFFQPYYYGPYSAEVQQAVSALLKKEVPRKVDIGFSLTRDLDLEADSVIDRFQRTADFISRIGLSATDDIAMLAKIHLLSHTEREEAKQNPVEYIQCQARFLGWKDLSKEDPDKIQNYLQLANNLDNTLES